MLFRWFFSFLYNRPQKNYWKVYGDIETEKENYYILPLINKLLISFDNS